MSPEDGDKKGDRIAGVTCVTISQCGIIKVTENIDLCIRLTNGKHAASAAEASYARLTDGHFSNRNHSENQDLQNRKEAFL